MHVIIHLIILFIFVWVLLILNIPGLEYDDLIKQKLYLFIGVFVFEFIVSIFTTIYQGCIINLGKIARYSLQSALLAVVAYSIFNDLKWTSNPLVAGKESEQMQKFIIAIFVILFIAMGYFLDLLFNDISPRMNDCFNKMYAHC